MYKWMIFLGEVSALNSLYYFDTDCWEVGLSRRCAMTRCARTSSAPSDARAASSPPLSSQRSRSTRRPRGRRQRHRSYVVTSRNVVSCTMTSTACGVTSLMGHAGVMSLPTTWTHDVIRFGKLAVCAPLPRHQYLMSVMATVELDVGRIRPRVALGSVR